MKIKAKDIQVLQIELGKKFDTRDEKLDFLSQFVGCDIKTSKDLTQYQAIDIIHFLKTGKQPNNTNWAYFDKNNTQHMNVLSQCITYGWSEVKKGKVIADLNRLGGWLKSFRSPVQKPLLEMETTELTTTINALKGMIKSKYK
jgi:prolyl-tRNA synthetase